MLKWHFSIAQQLKPKKLVQIYFVEQFSFWRTQLLIVRETLETSEKGLL